MAIATGLLGKLKNHRPIGSELPGFESRDKGSRVVRVSAHASARGTLGRDLGHNWDRSKPATRNQFGNQRDDGSMQNAGGRDSEIWTTERLPRLTQNRECTHLGF